MDWLLDLSKVVVGIYCAVVLIMMIIILWLKDGIRKQHAEGGEYGGLFLWGFLSIIPVINLLFLIYVSWVLLGPEDKDESTDWHKFDPDT